MRIKNTEITRDGPPFILAEIGVNHNGSVDLGRKLVDAASRARVDAVKFQLFKADLLLAKEAALVDYQKTAATSAEDLLSHLELSPEDMKQLVDYAHSLNLAAIITPFSVPLVDVAAAMGIDALKLASPDLVNRPLVEAAIKTNLPLILSTGQATLEEIDRTLTWLGPAADRSIFLHCVSSYPTPADHATLGAIHAMRIRYPGMLVGYSDHTLQGEMGAMAVMAGACVLEKHLTLDKTAIGPDHAASMELEELAEYEALARRAFAIRGPIQKQPSPLELQIRDQSRQSVVAVKDLPAGTKLTAESLTIKRPGTGIPAADFSTILGKTLKAPAAANTLLKPDQIA